MTFDELREVLDFINENNSPVYGNKKGCPTVKYVDPVIDMRDQRCFCIEFRGYVGGGITFTTVNQGRDHPLSLKERVMLYLTGNDDGSFIKN